jgi:hypothetical protein
MKKTKQQLQQERKSSGIRLDTELVKKLKILAIKRDCKPNQLLEEAIVTLLKHYGEVWAIRQGSPVTVTPLPFVA